MLRIRPINPNPATARRRSRRGFTLLESLIASAILMGIVTAVTIGVVSGQQNAFEAQERIAATVAAEALLGEIASLDTPAQRATWNGYVEDPGSMVDMAGEPMPTMFDSLGRIVSVKSTSISLTSPNFTADGQTVAVQVVDENGRVVAELQRFVPDPS